MIVNVTQQHIDDGVQNDCYACPIALAIKQQYQNDSGRPLSIWVDLERVSIETDWSPDVDPDGDDYIHLRGNLPHEACDFIRKFDEPIKQAGLKPFSFELELR